MSQLHALQAEIPAHLPGEPPLPTPGRIGLELVARTVLVGVFALLALPLWPLYLLLRLLWGRPPVLPSGARFVHALGLLLGTSLPLGERLLLGLALLRRGLAIPLSGLAWFLDEALYGRALDRVEVREPFFELSAARSGSTQLAHYIEDDPRICAPNLLQVAFPYLWLWRLVQTTLGRVLTQAQARKLFFRLMPPAYLKRHEMDPFRTDTFEMIVIIAHLGDLFLHLGPGAFAGQFSAGRITPTNRAFWEEDFLPFLDRIARKTLIFSGTEDRRLMIKGHFLAAAPALERRYPDARFLTVLRAPGPRIRSMLNFYRYQPGELGFLPVPWSWVVGQVLEMELDYCGAEMDWYTSPGTARRFVVRFESYVLDLEGTMRWIYRECLGAETLPPHVPLSHAPRERSNYLVDRSLAQLGVDTDALDQRLAEYRRWVGSKEQQGQGQRPSPSPASTLPVRERRTARSGDSPSPPEARPAALLRGVGRCGS